MEDLMAFFLLSLSIFSQKHNYLEKLERLAWTVAMVFAQV